MGKEKIQINFSDFWRVLKKTDNYFYNLLKQKFEVEILDNPNYLFFSVFGRRHRKYRCKKIFYDGENMGVDMDYADWAFSTDFLDHPRHYRLAHFLLYGGYYELEKEKNEVDESLASRKFCNFIVGNPRCEKRNNFLNVLSKYKKVDSAGTWMNNTGFLINSFTKRKFQSEYKFSIAFESGMYRREHEGCTSEKILDPMTVDSVPIYWGNPRIGADFNPKSFINYYDFGSENEMTDYIIYLDQNNDKYLELLSQPRLPDGKIPENHRIENIKSFLYGIFEQ